MVTVEEQRSRDSFVEALVSFQTEIERAIAVSDRNLGVMHTGRQNRVLFLFAKMITHNMSIAEMIDNVMRRPVGARILDHFSVVSLARVSIDASIMALYLSEPALTVEKWKLRWLVLLLHDTTTRKRFLTFFAKLGGADEDAVIDGYKAAKLGFKTDIATLARPLGYTEERIEKLLKGDVFVDGLRGAVREAGIELDRFEAIHVYFSSYVHSYPVSFMRADQHEISFSEPSAFQLHMCELAMKAILEFFPKAIDRVESFCESFYSDPLGEIEWPEEGA